MGKIIVIGAGQGGLVAAKHLKNFGHDVVVYEAESRENAAHPWRDDIRRAVFEEAGLTPIPVSDCVQKNKWKFVSPDEKSTLKVPMTPPLEEIAIDRRYLLEYLLKECEGVEVNFESPVESLITDGDKVAGVRVNGQDVRADMVIDASGYNSKFRREVPKKFGIPEPASDDKFCAFRGYYRADLNKNLPNPPCTLYIKHLGGVGISWCNLSQDNVADVLVGRVDITNRVRIFYPIIVQVQLKAVCGKRAAGIALFRIIGKSGYGQRSSRIDLAYLTVQVRAALILCIALARYVLCPMHYLHGRVKLILGVPER